jgi:hypothetical protein
VPHRISRRIRFVIRGTRSVGNRRSASQGRVDPPVTREGPAVATCGECGPLTALSPGHPPP